MALDYKLIGKRIKDERVKKGYTQEYLSEKLNFTTGFLSRIERENSEINLKRLNQICEILGIQEGTILNGVSTESNSYLSDEFSNLLKDCPPDKTKLIYKIVKEIVEFK